MMEYIGAVIVTIGISLLLLRPDPSDGTMQKIKEEILRKHGIML